MSAIPTPPPTNDAAGAHWLRRLVRCCRVLGPWLGFRYWRLQNRALRDPHVVSIWIEAWEAGAKDAEAKGDYLFAGCLRGMIRETQECRRRYFAANH